MKKLLQLFFICGISFAAQAQWSSMPYNQDPNTVIASISAINTNETWAITAGNVNEYQTSNGGVTWNIKGRPNSIFGSNLSFPTCLSAIDLNTAWATTRDNSANSAAIFKTTDGGVNWIQHATAFGQNSYARSIHFFDNNNGVAMGDAKGGYIEIYTTSDGGSTWNRVPVTNLPLPFPNQDFGGGQDLYSVSGNTIWLGIGGMRILKSTNKGLNWTVSDPNLTATPTGLPRSIAFKDAMNGLVKSDTEIKRTTDGGLTWTTVNYSGPVKTYITNVPGTANAYISAGIGGSSFSTDGGYNWTIIETAKDHSQPKFVSPDLGWSSNGNKLYRFSSSVLNTKENTDGFATFRISPNPSSAIFTVTTPSEKSFNLEVFDLVGNKVKMQKGNNFGENIIDLSGQKKGIYLLHILSGESRFVEKIVLQ